MYQLVAHAGEVLKLAHVHLGPLFDDVVDLARAYSPLFEVLLPVGYLVLKSVKN